MLDSCGFHSNTGIDELKDKCLITEEYWGSIIMHDLVQEMGREIVRQESPNNPGKRSRLWFHEDVQRVLEDDTGTIEVQGILIDLPKPIHLSPKAFEKMTSLRLLICRNACLSEEPNFLSNELRLIDWVGYPGEYFPPNFRGKYLVILKMAHSRIKLLDGVQRFQSLTTMDFYNCKFLEKIPDVSRIPHLKSLKLLMCENLIEVHESVGILDNLVELIIAWCNNLRSFPEKLELRSLKYLKFFGCSMLKNFPEITYPMEYLENIECYDTGIEELPSSVRNLVGLKKLYLGSLSQIDCFRVDDFEILRFGERYSYTCRFNEVISPLQFLGRKKESNLTNFSESNILKLLGCCSMLYHLNLSGTGIVTLPRCIESFVGLKSLYLVECKQLREILGLPPNVEDVIAGECVSLEIFLEGSRRSQLFNTEDPPELVGVRTEIPAQQSLRKLDLSGSAIVSLPILFNKFVKLEELHLRDCKQLQKILVLPPNVREVTAQGCSSLEVFLGEARRSQLFNTFLPPNPLWVGTASSALQPLEQKFQLECSFNSFEDLYLRGSAIVSLPTFFNRFVRLSRLDLEGCMQLREVPELPQNIQHVYLDGCTSLEIFPFNNINDLPKLWRITFSYCPEQIGNAVHNHLSSLGHSIHRAFECIYSGNRIPDGFSYCKEVSNTNLCEIDTGALHFDSKNTTLTFSAVIGRRDDRKGESCHCIDVEGFSNGQQIQFARTTFNNQFVGQDRVLFIYRLCDFQLTTNNLRVKFTIDNNYSHQVFFKSCAFHIIEQGYDDGNDDDDDDDDDGDDDDDDGDDERHSLHFCSKRRRNDDDEEDGNGTHNNRGILRSRK